METVNVYWSDGLIGFSRVKSEQYFIKENLTHIRFDVNEEDNEVIGWDVYNSALKGEVFIAQTDD